MGSAADDADLRVRLVNADGSEAEISGNGTRCVAAWYCAEHHRDTSVVIRTGAGLKNVRTDQPGTGNTFRVSQLHGRARGRWRVLRQVRHGEVQGTPVSMGNPHYVISLRSSSRDGRTIAEQIANHHDFKQGTER